MSKLLYMGLEQELSLNDKEDHVVVIVPSSAVLIKSVKLPKTNDNKLRQAIPYALEEDIIDDVETLHFALGQWNETGLAVVVIAKIKLKSWLDELSHKTIQPTHLIPSVFALPWKNKTWTLVMFDDHALLRTGVQSGLSIGITNIAFTLQILINEAKENLPETIVVYNYSKNTLPSILIEFKIIDNPPEFLQLASETIKSIKPINLLQGKYKVKHKASALRRNWQLAGIITLIWIGVILLTDIANYFYYQWENNKLNQQISVLFKEVFPNTRAVVEPKIAVERALKRLQISASGGPFLQLLGKTGNVLKNRSEIHIKNLNFSQNLLQFKITATSFAELDKLNNELRQLGLTVTQSNVT